MGARVKTEAPFPVPPLLLTFPTRNMPAAPILAVKVLSEAMLTRAVFALVAPVAPPTWKVPPELLTTSEPPPVKFTLVVSVAEAFAPSVTGPFTVRVLPDPMMMLAAPVALPLVACRPPIV